MKKKKVLTTLLVVASCMVLDGLYAGVNKANFDDFDFVKISGQAFVMGSNYTIPKQRVVDITYDFEMLNTEVTQALYYNVTGENPSYYKDKVSCPDSYLEEINSETNEVVSLCPHRPVESVNIYQINKFLKKLNFLTGEEYRLPTEAEWELAAREGVSDKFFFGIDENKLKDYAVYRISTPLRYHTPQDVGPYRLTSNLKSNFGLYDMHGNVGEWTSDWYSPKNSGTIDPRGAVSADSQKRKVVKGGYYNTSNKKLLEGAYRYFYSEWVKSSGLGFRVVREL